MGDLTGGDRLPRDPVIGRWTGHAGQLFRDRFAFMQRAWRSDADVLTVRYFQASTHLVLSPAGVQEVLVGKARAFSKATLGYRELERITGRGILTDDGPSWRAHRGAVQPYFAPARAKAAAARTVALSDRTLATAWRGGERDLFATMNALGMALLLDYAFDHAPVDAQAPAPARGCPFTSLRTRAGSRRRKGGVSETLSVLLDVAHRRIGTRPPWLNRARQLGELRFRRARATVDGLVDQLVAGRADRDGVVRALIAFCADPARARDELRTLLLAGHETTATALTWTFALLAHHPAWQDAIAAAPDDDDATLLAVIQESLRLYPPIWSISRRAEEDVDIAGTAIARGQTVIVSPYLVQRHPRHVDGPDQFRPERFLERRVAADAFFPFGAGQRLCVGRSLAMVQLKAIVRTACRRYRLSPHPGDAMPSPRATITLRPASTVRLRVTPR